MKLRYSPYYRAPSWQERSGRGGRRVTCGVSVPGPTPKPILLLFLLPTDNVQLDLQHGSLITFPKDENLGNKRKLMHIVRSETVFFLGHACQYMCKLGIL